MPACPKSHTKWAKYQFMEIHYLSRHNILAVKTFEFNFYIFTCIIYDDNYFGKERAIKIVGSQENSRQG